MWVFNCACHVVQTLHFAGQAVVRVHIPVYGCCMQGQISHWANRANARGLALLEASLLNIKRLLYLFFMFFGCSPRVKIVEILVWLAYGLRKWKTLALIVFECLKRIEANSITLYDPRIESKSVQPRASAEIFHGGNVEVLLVLFRLLTMQCKWTFTKLFTLSIPLVCAGWTSILNLLSEMFSTLRLSGMPFLFINCLISISSSTFYK